MADDDQQPDDQPVIQSQPTRSPAMTPAPPPEKDAAAARGLDMSVADQQPASGGENDEPGEQEKGIIPTRFQQLDAVLQQTSDKSLVGIPGFTQDNPGSMLRALSQNAMQSQDSAQGIGKLSPEDANKQFPGMPVPFNEPIDPKVAAAQFNSFQQRQNLQAWKDRGAPLPGWMETGVGMVGGTFDPVNLGLMLGTGPLAEGVGIPARALESFWGTVGTNAAINVATGVPNYLEEKSEHQDVTPTDALIEGVEGTVANVGLHYGVRATLGLFSKAKAELSKTPQDIQAKTMQEAIIQHESGSTLDTSGGERETQDRLQGKMADGQTAYEYHPVDDPTKTPFFAARDSSGQPFSFEDLGPGVSMIDDGVAANHMVSNPEGEAGKIGQARLPDDTKLLNIEQSAASPELEPFIAKLEEANPELKVEVQPDESLKDVIVRLSQDADQGIAPVDIMGQIQEIAKNEGYHGYQGVLDVPGGEPKNLVHLFDPSFIPQDEFKANGEITPTRSPEQTAYGNEQVGQPKNAEGYSAGLEKDVRDLKHGPSTNSTPEYMDPIIQEQLDSAMNQLNELAKENPGLKEEIKKILGRDSATDAQEKSLMEKFTNCVAGSMT